MRKCLHNYILILDTKPQHTCINTSIIKTGSLYWNYIFILSGRQASEANMTIFSVTNYIFPRDTDRLSKNRKEPFHYLRYMLISSHTGVQELGRTDSFLGFALRYSTTQKKNNNLEQSENSSLMFILIKVHRIQQNIWSWKGP